MSDRRSRLTIGSFGIASLVIGIGFILMTGLKRGDPFEFICGLAVGMGAFMIGLVIE